MRGSGERKNGLSSAWERTLNFLLIDDDDICLFVHRRVLELSPYCNSMLSLKNAENAIELLRDASADDVSVPDVILLDLEMPGMNGIAFLEAFRKLRCAAERRISVVLVTSSMCERAKQYAISLGVVQCLSKPLTQEALTPVIDLIIRNNSFERFKP